jgi:starch phosphorylase
MVLADFESYARCQERVATAYLDSAGWNRKSILNVAAMGKFSSDRTTTEYAERIWNVKPVAVELTDAGTELPRL